MLSSKMTIILTLAKHKMINLTIQSGNYAVLINAQEANRISL